jgi:hypothetical protein
LKMVKEPVRIAAVAAAVGFLLQATFQAALALGAPLGSASWGGAYEGQLPMGLRIASGVAVGVYVLFALIVLGRGGFRGVLLPYGVLRWGDMGAGRTDVFGSASEPRVVERVGALWVGTLGADPGSPVLVCRA